MNSSSIFYVKVGDEWRMNSDSLTGYNIVEEFTHCQECHIFLSGFNGPQLALCNECFTDEENRNKTYNVRRIFGQS